MKTEQQTRVSEPAKKAVENPEKMKQHLEDLLKHHIEQQEV